MDIASAVRQHKYGDEEDGISTTPLLGNRRETAFIESPWASSARKLNPRKAGNRQAGFLSAIEANYNTGITG